MPTCMYLMAIIEMQVSQLSRKDSASIHQTWAYIHNMLKVHFMSQLVGIDALYTTIGNGDFMNLYETNIMFIATDDNGQQI